MVMRALIRAMVCVADFYHPEFASRRHKRKGRKKEYNTYKYNLTYFKFKKYPFRYRNMHTLTHTLSSQTHNRIVRHTNTHIQTHTEVRAHKTYYG